MLRRHATFLLASVLAACFLVGCETLDFAGIAKSNPEPEDCAPECPVPGYTRSGETFGGTMSWYSVRTNGGTKTASGERFSDDAETAAHRTLPFGTLVEVTNLSNEESVVLKINDRGPFKHGRVLDVSIGAAKRLGFEKQGLSECRVEVLKPLPEGDAEEERPDSEATVAEARGGADPSALSRLFTFAPVKTASPRALGASGASEADADSGGGDGGRDDGADAEVGEGG